MTQPPSNDRSQGVPHLILEPKAKATAVMPGSTSLRAECGHVCYISAEGRAYQKRHPDAITVCRDCLDPLQLPAAGKMFYAVPGAVDAIALEAGIRPEVMASVLNQLYHLEKEPPEGYK